MSVTPIQIPFVIKYNITVGYQAPTISKVSAPVKKTISPVGPAYASHALRVNKKITIEDHEAILAKELEAQKFNTNGDGEEEIDDGVGEEPESRSLLESDPREWKNQDQYAVLGLSSLRWKATPDQIKRAHRKKVLRHHPDKKAGQAGNSNDDSFFKCIAKAYEVLSDPIKRRQFDSVDEMIDDTDVPTDKDVSTSPTAFFKAYGPVFEREARFSTKLPAPSIGDENSTRDEVEAFYDFWLKFDSWRSFEWKDKDANEGSDSRTEKRHIENKNRSERERRKKEDNARRRNIVETALALDPRMKRFKAEERQAREAKKKGGSNPSGTATPTISAAEKKEQEEAQLKAKAELEKKAADEKSAKEAAKKVKEAAKKNLKKEKKTIQGLVTGLNYFLPDGQSANPSIIETQLSELDLLTSGLEPEEVTELRKAMERSGKDKAAVKAVVVKFSKKVSDAGKGSFVEFS
ncbi:hypothetical protein CROQUDRAFT_655811 [Cronartium quercuum f. sp. fusiforme G11]|uniref:J domain-containing protein n=1 Tax=Cronartium quercuum f. sp. fusiforme G11 TaxID=708437 RepID=A0A9P6NKR4_9BASI|nr:hypothetical protein CROQUDRAFT_655811 [Cronartium quercuum f. sp. fusiforme G11]